MKLKTNRMTEAQKELRKLERIQQRAEYELSCTPIENTATRADIQIRIDAAKTRIEEMKA